MPTIICLDFDGVVHSYHSGWKGYGNIPDPPVPGALAFIADCIDNGFQVHIFSSRSKSLRGRFAMKSWLEQHMICRFGHGTGDDYFACIKWPWFKPKATITIDDRAWQFKGIWPLMSQIKAFEPWKCDLSESEA